MEAGANAAATIAGSARAVQEKKKRMGRGAQGGSAADAPRRAITAASTSRGAVSATTSQRARPRGDNGNADGSCRRLSVASPVASPVPSPVLSPVAAQVTAPIAASAPAAGASSAPASPRRYSWGSGGLGRRLAEPSEGQRRRSAGLAESTLLQEPTARRPWEPRLSLIHI